MGEVENRSKLENPAHKKVKNTQLKKNIKMSRKTHKI